MSEFSGRALMGTRGLRKKRELEGVQVQVLRWRFSEIRFTRHGKVSAAMSGCFGRVLTVITGRRNNWVSEVGPVLSHLWRFSETCFTRRGKELTMTKECIGRISNRRCEFWKESLESATALPIRHVGKLLE